jgi:Rrf2 family protein
MFVYGQTAANAIAVMSYLAADPARRAGSGEIAAARNISKALTAKLLTHLASARLVVGQPGPGGGYNLAKHPSEISLLDIVSLFEKIEPPDVCAFGHGWCGTGKRCPLHNPIEQVVAVNRRFLEGTHLAVFLGAKKQKFSSETVSCHLQ